MTNFWQNIKQPILALAPMAGVTDGAFRQICSEFGADVVYTEMANVKALYYKPKKTLEMLRDKKRKSFLVVQLFGSEPEFFYRAIKLIEKEVGPDGIDINFGCPAPKVIKTKAGAELFQDLDLSYEVIRASIEATKLPVSVKCRIRAGGVDVFDFWDRVGDLDIKAIMLHGRTFSQGFSGDIDCRAIRELKDKVKIPVLANGGIFSLEQAEKILKDTRVDGLGVARGAMGRPWIFEELKKNQDSNKTYKQIVATVLKQARITWELKGERGILEMRKHLCWYVQGFSGAKEIRQRLIRVKSVEDIRRVLET